MKQTLLHEKYPVFVAEIAKSETDCRDIDAVVAHFRQKVAENPRVHFIDIFDHLAHTRRIGGEIAPEIQGAVDIVFCFGYALPNPQILAVRPRSIGVADLGDRYVISFMEAPMHPANQAMEAWTRTLRRAS